MEEEEVVWQWPGAGRAATATATAVCRGVAARRGASLYASSVRARGLSRRPASRRLRLLEAAAVGGLLPCAALRCSLLRTTGLRLPEARVSTALRRAGPTQLRPSAAGPGGVAVAGTCW